MYKIYIPLTVFCLVKFVAEAPLEGICSKLTLIEGLGIELFVPKFNLGILLSAIIKILLYIKISTKIYIIYYKRVISLFNR